MSDDIKKQLDAEAERFERERDVERDHVRAAPAKKPSQVYSIRIPVDNVEAVRQLAQDRDRAPTSMLREWILDRLEVETASQGGDTTQKVVRMTVEWDPDDISSTLRQAR